jgi:cytochrome c oxidase subunit 4
MDAHQDAHSSDGIAMPKPHVCSSQTFMGILLALLFLTFITVYISRFDFGSANMLLAMAVASVKASLVVAIFMHMLWDTTINKIFFISSFLFLGLLFLFTFADLLARADLETRHGRVAPLDPSEMPEFTSGSEKRFFDQYKSK